MSIAAIKQALVTSIEALPGIGQVHNRMRRLPRTPTQQDVQRVFGIDDQTSERGWSLRAWMWYRRGRPARHETVDTMVTSFTHRLILQGYWEINDAYDSETEWNMMCDAITRQFQPFEGSAMFEVASGWTLPAITVEAEATIVGLYECHDVELTMDILDIEDYTPEGE